jgi:hypothetical protein
MLQRIPVFSTCVDTKFSTSCTGHDVRATGTSHVLACFGVQKRVFRFFRAHELSNFWSMAADDLAYVRACSTASTPAYIAPDLLSLLINY